MRKQQSLVNWGVGLKVPFTEKTIQGNTTTVEIMDSFRHYPVDYVDHGLEKKT